MMEFARVKPGFAPENRPPAGVRGGMGIIPHNVTPAIGSAPGRSGVAEDGRPDVDESGKVVRIKTTAVGASGRAARGARLIPLEENDRVVSVTVAGESE